MREERTTLYSLPPKVESDFSFTRPALLSLSNIFRLISRIFLSESLYQQVLVWEKTRCIRFFFARSQKFLRRGITILHRTVDNFAPKYVEYKLFFKDGEVEDDLVKNVCGFGQSLNSNEEALSKATGEFFERYYLAKDWNKLSITATPDELGDRAACFGDAPLYLPWQQEVVAKDFVTRETYNKTNLEWIAAEALLSGQESYVPLQRVFWMVSKPPSVGVINHPTSNGNAGGFTFHTATLSGIYELIERDSFMCFWYQGIAPDIIDASSVETPWVEKQRELFRRYAIQVYFLDITTTLQVPSVLCVLINTADQQDPKITVGAACGYNVGRLFDTSFIEALTVQRYHWGEVDSRHQDESTNTSGYFDDREFDNNQMEKRIMYWRGHKKEKILKDLLCKGRHISFKDFQNKHNIRPFNSSKNELKFIEGHFSKLVHKYGLGFYPYVYQHQSPLLRRIGYHVASVVVPNLYPLHLVEYMATLDISRMHHWRETAGIQSIEWTGNIKNVYPHPFP